jgi:hypothetical protein
MSDIDEARSEDAAPPQAIGLSPFRQPRWRRSFLLIALEMVLISASVFLGLIGQQWYEDSRRREDAMSSLRRFRTEMAINREEITKKLDYHARTHKMVRAFVRADAEGRQSMSVGFEQGISPPFFERTAWDLGVATQSLTYMNPELAFWLSRTYTFQNLVDALTRAFTDGMFVNPPSTTSEVFLRSLDLYYGDLVDMEPNLLKMYDTVLPMIDAALAE